MLVTKLFRNTIYCLFGSTTNVGVSNVGVIKRLSVQSQDLCDKRMSIHLLLIKRVNIYIYTDKPPKGTYLPKGQRS